MGAVESGGGRGPAGPGSGPPPVLLAVGGLVASGKSTAARWLARRLGAAHLAADAVRRDLREHGRPGGWDPEAWRPIYRELLQRAAGELAAGRSVVLDGSFRTRAARAAARRLAREHGVRFRLVECRAAPEVLQRRLAAREREEGHPGWTEIAEGVAEGWESAVDLPGEEHRILDTGGDPAGLPSRLERLASEALGVIEGR